MGVERGRASQRSHGMVSQRSYGTSSSSSHGSRTKCKNCCRKFVSFMCTQVGVGCLVVSYAIFGAFAFQNIEVKANLPTTVLIHDDTIRTLWNFTERHNVLHKDQWYEDVNQTLFDFQMKIVEVVKVDGYNGKTAEEVWNFPASLMFCLSVFSMIGYGHMTPKTEWGKIATIIYAVFGIPLYIVYFMNMGRVFAKSFKFLYRFMYRCLNNGRGSKSGAELEIDDEGEEVIIVPSTACIWVMIFYMTTGTIMFAEWEQWQYLDSCYFSFTSLAKIGIGDFVPGFGGDIGTEASKDSKTKLMINFMYLLIGMGIIAMCYTLMKEEIMLKLRALEQDIKEKLFICGLKLGLYEEEQPYLEPQPPSNHHRSRSLRKSVRRR